ncbi:type 1 glutamine amidotransferase domain-containing protein [Kitasatospora sp. KL5]|uniref:type 1 glutamine amidotransferase domain-containing protein n=1 Tax=Kitasatospora sp. KL5 TaxID=3425125 RepID=UPI003D6E8AF3
MSKLLFVVTGATHWTLNDGTRHPTGFWAEELLTPYKVFTEAGHEVVLATPGGVVPAADPGSLAPEVNGGRDVAPEPAGISALAAPLKLEEVDLAANRADGTSAFAGRKITAFSNEEERQGGLAAKAIWLLEDRLEDIGADVQVASPWTPNVVVHGNLLTGQNPMSSGPLAVELLRQLG